MAASSGALVYFSSIAIILLSCFECNVVAQSTHGSIGLGLSFTGNQSIQSNDGRFQLGLFRPPGNNASYLGIWFKSISPQTVVWVANRNQPAFGNASFSLSWDGDLVVLDSHKTVLWTSGTNGMNVSTAVLMNTGNLVLQTRKSSIIWDSFGHPANVLLPSVVVPVGMKFISWKSPSDPAEGPYSLQLLETRELVLIWNDSRKYWTSGVWNGEMFTNIPEMSKRYISNFSFDAKSRFAWSLFPNASSFINSKFLLNTNGQITQSSWLTQLNGWTTYWAQPTDRCNVYGVCGQYGLCNSTSSDFCGCPAEFEAADTETWSIHGYSSGCKPKVPLTCSADSSNDKFLLLDRTSFDLQGFSHIMSRNSESLCKSACLQNCSCAAYHYDNIAKNCSLMSEVIWSSSGVSSVAVNLRVSAEYRSSPKRHKKARVAILLSVVGGCSFLILIILGLFLLRRKVLEAKSSSRYIPGVLQWFSYKQVQSATKNFKEKIGSGGFGAVYKGFLSDNTPVAVKKLQLSDQGEKQFRTEVSTIGNIQHVNLVRLLGFCSERSHRLLLLEYMPNGSLDHVLFRRPCGSSSGAVLDWNTRYQIALGTARAIAYLHEECRECIIHLDIKPGNILLDANFAVKVSDFGLAKLVGREFSHVLTSMRGTRGYLAPEWMSGGTITAKADVYSFGMTLLEIISGRRNMDEEAATEKQFFPVWAATQMSKVGGGVACLADARLEGKVEEEEVRRAAYTAVWCIQDDEKMRPRMGTVVRILEGTVEVTLPPVPKSLLSLDCDS